MRRPRPLLVFFSNAIDDVVRAEREITTDSPAATRKVLQLARATRDAGARSIVLSLGRGRADGSSRNYPARVRRVGGVPVVYMPFSRRRGQSQILSMFAGIPLLRRLRRRSPEHAVLFYNRLPAYLAALAASRALGYRASLDLEDGEVGGRRWTRSWARGTLLRGVFDLLLDGPAVVACRQLASATRRRPVMCCYGTATEHANRADWSAPEIRFLLGGTVAPETGAHLLADAIRILRAKPEIARQMRFDVTGQGPSLPAFASLSTEPAPRVIVHGRASAAEYQAIVETSHVGLALKPNDGPLANTTFPSKVLEIGSHGCLLLTTDISDVREVFGDHALYLTEDTAEALAERLEWVVRNRPQARAIAEAGMRVVAERCSPRAVGSDLYELFFGATERPPLTAAAS